MTTTANPSYRQKAAAKPPSQGTRHAVIAVTLAVLFGGVIYLNLPRESRVEVSLQTGAERRTFTLMGRTVRQEIVETETSRWMASQEQALTELPNARPDTKAVPPLEAQTWMVAGGYVHSGAFSTRELRVAGEVAETRIVLSALMAKNDPKLLYRYLQLRKAMDGALVAIQSKTSSDTIRARTDTIREYNEFKKAKLGI